MEVRRHAAGSTGVVPMPAPDEQMLGGHAVLAVGYDDATQRFLVRNSWGPGRGLSGYFTMPYSYLHRTQPVRRRTLRRVS